MRKKMHVTSLTKLNPPCTASPLPGEQVAKLSAITLIMQGEGESRPTVGVAPTATYTTTRPPDRLGEPFTSSTPNFITSTDSLSTSPYSMQPSGEALMRHVEVNEIQKLGDAAVDLCLSSDVLH